MRNIALLFTAATADGARTEAGTFDHTTVGDRRAAALLKPSVRDQPEPARHQPIGKARVENVLAVLPRRQHNLAPSVAKADPREGDSPIVEHDPEALK